MADSGVGITTEYLENALGFPIERFEVKLGSNLGDGFTCAMYGVEVYKKSEPPNPVHIIIKSYPVSQAGQSLLEEMDVFGVELAMYNTVIPALEAFQEILPEGDRVELPFAPFISGQFVKPEDRSKLGQPLSPLDNNIVMPDLRRPENGPFLLRDRFLGFDLDHYRLVIEAQAKLHAVSWAYKCRMRRKSLQDDFPELISKLGEFYLSSKNFIPDNFKANKKIFQDDPKTTEGLSYLETIFPSIMGLYFDCDAGQGEKGHTKDNILRCPGNFIEGEEPWMVLLHGDCWSNNFMFCYDEKTGKPVEVIFIDLQLCRDSDPMNDICYGLYFNAQPDLRKKHLQTILRIYFDTFTEICEKFGVPALPGWSWEEFNRRFHRAKVAGLHMVLFMHFLLKSPDDMKNLNNVTGKKKGDGNGSGDALDDVGGMIKAAVSDLHLHPAVKPRLSAVFEELIDEGVI